MRLGIDFGTTRIIVAFVDRGNYPVVSFEAPDGTAREWFPPLVAVKDQTTRLRVGGVGGAGRAGLDGGPIAQAGAGRGGPGNPGSDLATRPYPCCSCFANCVRPCASNLLEHSNLPAVEAGLLEVMLGVPANANSNQRFLTAEAFRQAGFHVLGLLNEPSAASIEFGHRDRATRQKKAREPNPRVRPGRRNL